MTGKSFQTPMFWKSDAYDYKRACLPALVPAGGGAIPGRLVYPLSERNAPSIPDRGPTRNWNDPNPC